MGFIRPEQGWEDGSARVLHSYETHQTKASRPTVAHGSPPYYETTSYVLSINFCSFWNGKHAQPVHSSVVASSRSCGNPLVLGSFRDRPPSPDDACFPGAFSEHIIITKWSRWAHPALTHSLLFF
ncbi:hypothetical protein MC885_001170, partial [Smutsia gigantea]